MEWTGEGQEALEVRHTDEKEKERLTKLILKHYKTRKAILKDVIKAVNTVGGYLDLSGLTSAAGLKLHDTDGGSLYLSGLTSAETAKIPAKYQSSIIK